MGGELFEVDAPDDPRIADFMSLTDMDLRRRVEEPAGLFIAEGFLVLERVLAAGLSVRTILTDAKRLPRVEALIAETSPSAQPDIAVATAEVLEQATGFRVHRGLLASVTRPPLRSVDEILATPGPVLALEGLVDPTNVGLAFRSAAAMGFTAAIVSGDCADPLYRRSVRTSMGAVIDLPWVRDAHWPVSLADAARTGRSVLALSPDSACEDLDSLLASLESPVVAVFGTEGPGLRERTRDMIGRCARIPMQAGIDSLNVAASVAVVGYALRSTGR